MNVLTVYESRLEYFSIFNFNSNYLFNGLIFNSIYLLFIIEMHSMKYLSVKLNAKFVPTLAKCFPFE